MNKISKIVILTMLFTGLVFARQTHVVNQIVLNWPDNYDTTGLQWVTYDLYHAETHVRDQDDIGNHTNYYSDLDAIRWYSDISNFPDWENGDTVVAFGSWDSAYAASPGTYGDNVNHTGFYWLYSDTMDAIEDPQDWNPRDTLRVLPQPYAYQVGGPTGNIKIEITNPAETRRVEQTEYDVLGFWIWADTTSGTHHDTAGRPDYFDLEVGFFSVDGDPGETTICTHSVLIYRGEQKVYWAYKLVARPDTTAGENPGSPGYSTHYFSQNSNRLVIIGIEENTSLKPGCIKLEISPNPFTNKTDITCSIGQSAKGIELKIFDVSGRLIRDFPIDLCNHNKSVKSVRWYGTDESGEQLPSGVYFVQAKGGDLNLTKKVILQRK